MDWLNSNAQARTSDNINVQGSEAWKSWRSKGLGGSDSASLLGWSPYKTALELWQEKVGLRKPEFSPFQLSAMERGKTLEPEIRKWYEEKVGAKFKEDIGEHKRHSFIRASYDGINFDFKNPDGSKGRILEIKAPNKNDHALAGAGMVPEKYLTQLNWMGMVSGIRWFDYVSFGSDGTYHVVTLQAEDLLQCALLERAISMWGYITSKTEPPADAFKKWERNLKPLNLTDVDAPQISEQEIEKLVSEALQLQKNIDLMDAQFSAIKEKLKKVLGDQEKLQCGEAVFGWQTRKGTVKYADIPELKTIDLEKYRGDDVKAFYFKRSKT
jgi:putative phage-type endonuclease